MAEPSFGQVDMLLFIGSLVLAMFVGLYHGYQDRKTQNLENFFFGSKKMSPVLLGMSMAVTYISAISFISGPAAVYQKGTSTFWWLINCIIPALPCVLFVLPMLFRLKPSNVFEFFELRYNSIMKKLVVSVYIFQQIAWMSIGIQMTASALSLATMIPVNWSVVLTVFICSIYTTMGGLKAIVWVDGIQSLIMLTGGITVTLYAFVQVGGVNTAFDNLDDAGLNNFFNFKFNLNETYTFYSYLFGISFSYLSYFCTNQSIAQRLQSCKSQSDAKKALFSFVLFSSIIYAIGVSSGIPMFSFFKGCDPVKSGEIKSPDQMVPLMVMKLFNNLPGFSGIFVSSVYSGMLSTVSSGTNSVAMTILEVFIRPNLKEMSDKRGMNISRILTVVISLLIILLAILVGKLGNIAWHLLIVVDSVFNAPVISIFIAGCIFPWITKKGGIFGLLVGTIFNAWVTIGQIVWGRNYKELKFEGSIENCTYISNATLVVSSTNETVKNINRSFLADTLYQIPIPYLGFIGFFNTMVCAVIFSFITGHKRAKDANSELFFPLVTSRVFPECVRKFFRFGVEHPSIKSEEYLMEETKSLANDKLFYKK